MGESSLEIYLINVIITREFDTLAPYLDIGPRHLFYYAVVYSLNLLLGITLHKALSQKHANKEHTGARIDNLRF